jgi:putative DNA primase/helicase
MPTIYHDTIVRYMNIGFAPIPIKFKSKQPAIEGWTEVRIGVNEIEKYFVEPTNICILTGAPSNNLIDVDIDDPEAARFAPYFLPKTHCVFGRVSKPESHWLYHVPHSGNRTTFLLKGKGMIVEVRGNGCCTVFPGSLHPSGEFIEFNDPNDFTPHKSSWEGLIRAATQIAIATAVHPSWSRQSHSRHSLALALAAFLARREWKQENVSKLIEAIANEANDEELEDRVRCVDDTFVAHGQGRQISGDEELHQLIGTELTECIGSWVSGKAAKKTKQLVAGESCVSRAGVIDITTDATAADAFATAFKERLVYCNGQWFYRRIQVLEPVNAEFVQGLAKEFFQEQVGKLAGGPFGLPAVKSSLSRARINAAVELSRSSFHADGASIDNNIDLLGLADGNVFDLAIGKIAGKDHVLVTKKVSGTLAPNTQCPRWLKFLDEIFQGDVDVIEFVRRAVGYSLSGSVAEQCLFILIGTGANGKSSFLKVLQHVLGAYAGTVPMSTLMEQRFGSQQTNDLAYLVGKRLVVGSEGERGQRLAEGKIKLMTGGDRIVCRSMYKDFFELAPQFKLWLATNDLPAISGTDDAIWRRIYVIEFPVSFAPEQQDKTLTDRLIQEASGIFAWAYQGYCEWKEHGLNPPPQVLHSTRSYRKDNDSVGQWLDASCVLEPGAKSTMKDLYQSYLGWCGNSGMEPLSNARFGKELTRRGFENIKGREGNGRRGIMLNPRLDPTSPDFFSRTPAGLRELDGDMRPH